jgi:hypothetical protein
VALEFISRDAICDETTFGYSSGKKKNLLIVHKMTKRAPAGIFTQARGGIYSECEIVLEPGISMKVTDIQRRALLGSAGGTIVEVDIVFVSTFVA